MNFSLDPRIALPLALVFGLLAWGFWYFLARPMPFREGHGVILERAFRESETVQRSTSRAHRSFEHIPKDVSYTLPDRHVYTIQMEGVREPIYATVPVAEGEYEPQTSVRIVYQHRWIPFLGHRYFVQQIESTSPRDEQ